MLNDKLYYLILLKILLSLITFDHLIHFLTFNFIQLTKLCPFASVYKNYAVNLPKINTISILERTSKQ